MTTEPKFRKPPKKAWYLLAIIGFTAISLSIPWQSLATKATSGTANSHRPPPDTLTCGTDDFRILPLYQKITFVVTPAEDENCWTDWQTKPGNWEFLPKGQRCFWMSYNGAIEIQKLYADGDAGDPYIGTPAEKRMDKKEITAVSFHNFSSRPVTVTITLWVGRLR